MLEIFIAGNKRVIIYTSLIINTREILFKKCIAHYFHQNKFHELFYQSYCHENSAHYVNFRVMQ